jgi:hypothetical protein
MAIVYRDEKGSPLTSPEQDANMRFVMELITAIQENPPQANGIANITVIGSEMTIFLDDGTALGPFTLPVAAFHWRGEFFPDTGYFVNDFLTSSNSIYLVLQDHVSDEEFDAAAQNTEGELYFQIWGPLDATFSTIVTVGTDTRQVSNTEAGSYYRCIHVDGCEVTIPTNAVAPFQIGDEIHFYQAAANPVVFSASGGVTFNPVDGYLFESAGRGRVITLKYVGSDVWDVFGGLAEDVSA